MNNIKKSEYDSYKQQIEQINSDSGDNRILTWQQVIEKNSKIFTSQWEELQQNIDRLIDEIDMACYSNKVTVYETHNDTQKETDSYCDAENVTYYNTPHKCNSLSI